MPYGVRKQLVQVLNTHVCYKRFKWTMESSWIYIAISLLAALLHVTCVSAIPSTIVVTSDATEHTKEGDDLQLTCLITVTSTETLNYVRWSRSGIVFSDFESLVKVDPLDRLSVLETIQDTFRAYTLRIAGVQTPDSGMYSCHVGFTDDSGSPSEISRSLSVSVVYYTPPSTSPQCETEVDVQNVTIGDLIRLTCASQKGNPIVNVTWTRFSPSGDMEDIPVTQLNHGKDLTLLVYSFFVLEEHNGNTMTCNIRSSVFPNFQRNCTIGPFVITDLATTTVTTTTTATTTSSTTTTTQTWLPTSESMSTTLNRPSNSMQTTGALSSARRTETTTSLPVSISSDGHTSNMINVSTDYITTNRSLSSTFPSNTTTITSTTTSAVMDNSSSVLPTTSHRTTYLLTSPLPSTPWIFSSFIMISVVTASALIMFLLICNVVMMTRAFINTNKTQRVVRRTIRLRSIHRNRNNDRNSDNQSEA